jgi:hypothetical protein
MLAEPAALMRLDGSLIAEAPESRQCMNHISGDELENLGWRAMVSLHCLKGTIFRPVMIHTELRPGQQAPATYGSL